MLGTSLRLALVTAVLFFVVGCTCGNTANIGGTGCRPSSCDGCCTVDGHCQSGLLASACGVSGAVCTACPAGAGCAAGVCTGASGSGGGGSAGGGSGGGGGGSAGGTGGFAGGEDGSVPYYDGGCGPIDAGNPPYPRRCVPLTDSECDGTTDNILSGGGVPSGLLNSLTGNGFDDDCDGLVDEGCPCNGNGITKDCWLVPATQVDPATSRPVGWCDPNAKGSLDCAGGELATWSGVCRGGQAPARWDSCAPGDFNCDGLSGNNGIAGCACATEVTCPTAPVTFGPFPPPGNLPLLDGSQWIADAAQRPLATNWTWTLLGGDCDNVLPHPTFALYDGASSATASRKGLRTPVRFDAASGAYLPASGQTLIAIRAASYGNGVAGGQIHPAFALSGDYLVQGEFDLNGQHHVCTQKVQVRAPGVRVELCWDTVGGRGGSGGNDIDLHFARLQGLTCGAAGWDDTCVNSGGSYADCYYARSSGCRDYSSSPPNWGYTSSTATACLGWGSLRTAGNQGCTNPRLDRDNVTCDPSVDDPNDVDFCGPENINLDNPNNADTFVVAVNDFDNHGGTNSAKPHINLYCNGQRVVSVGYNPATGQIAYPLLMTPGQSNSGDFWTVATLKTNVTAGQLTSCDVTTLPSRHADATRDGPGMPAGGPAGSCVDSTDNRSPTPNTHSYTTHQWIEWSGQGGTIGGIPSSAAQWCKH